MDEHAPDERCAYTPQAPTLPFEHLHSYASLCHAPELLQAALGHLRCPCGRPPPLRLCWRLRRPPSRPQKRSTCSRRAPEGALSVQRAVCTGMHVRACASDHKCPALCLLRGAWICDRVASTSASVFDNSFLCFENRTQGARGRGAAPCDRHAPSSNRPAPCTRARSPHLWIRMGK